MSVYRIYVEKKPEFAAAAKTLLGDIKTALRLDSLRSLRIINRYDAENISEDNFNYAADNVFSEPAVDVTYRTLPALKDDERVFAVEYLPGQFDQRADSCEQCIQILTQGERCKVRNARVYITEGRISDSEFEALKKYIINPVESREASLDEVETLKVNYTIPETVETLTGFITMDDMGLANFVTKYGLAMDSDDLKFCRDYFRDTEKRDPTITEIRMIDTYWSDHCRHTTFSTVIDEANIDADYIRKTYNEYIDARKELGRENKPITLMDIATIGAKKLKKEGILKDLDESEEINACSVKIKVDVDGELQDWLLMFKNETHNPPTEIEPFGGAATCLGGAIRDPLSGRSYVYQAMRVTGASNPLVPVEDTIHGKLPQRKITVGAANGHSSYGNQIGLATGLVNEVYHPNYVAKRMEIGAVMGAAPRKNVIRENSDPGDIIILLGGRTGRDGCGGATGSSKAHNTQSIDTCGAEVQKGNAPTERKIQRLFRREEVSSIIKKCNDFGAGGVSVAIGELAAGLKIDLDKVPKKYAGLDGTELAISESQERMAVVVDPADVDKMLGYAAEENLEAVAVAVVTEEPRLVMSWRNKVIVNLSRAFLDTNGAHQEPDAVVTMPDEKESYFAKAENAKTDDFKAKWLDELTDLNVCSQKGLVEMFDSSIGAGTVLMPYGGKYQLTPIQTMVAKLPVLEGKCDTVTMMSYGLDPFLSSWSPYHGSQYAVLSSVAKIVAAGGDYHRIRFTFQEYFKRLGTNPENWGEPMSALLGAYEAQMRLSLPSIGGKDSMSGTFNEISVPPTLCSFAVSVGKISDVITPEFKKAGSKIVAFDIKKDKYELPDYDYVIDMYDKIAAMIDAGILKSVYAIGYGGICEAVSKMAFGNKFGVKICDEACDEKFFAPLYGGFVAEIDEADLSKLSVPYMMVGQVTEDAKFTFKGGEFGVEEAITTWKSKLEKVFPTVSEPEDKGLINKLYDKGSVYIARNKIAVPEVFVPVFPGTNCEYDTSHSFRKAGAKINSVVFRNMSESDIRESVDAFEKAIRKSQILMISGGFSAGDEPDGSAKFIASVFRNERLSEAVHDLLDNRDGLVLGICNGFQALIKLGLVPYGKICEQKADSPTLTTNSIGRHISQSVYTKVVSNKSPWMLKANVGDVYTIPASHGEGRFVANKEWIDKLYENGQVATQYVDINGNPTMDEAYNPNGSYCAIEGITSADGRVLGKMAHSERIGNGVAINIYGEQDQKLFESGVEYFK